MATGTAMPSGGRRKSTEEVRISLYERLAAGRAPFHIVDREEAAAAIGRLKEFDGDGWGEVWGQAGQKLEQLGALLEASGDRTAALDKYLKAYGLYYVGRYPAPSHPGKAACYGKAREMMLRAGALMNPPLERVAVPFSGRAGEGREVAFYFRRPAIPGQIPVVVRWSGIDTWKEERHDINEAFLARGLASITMDMPGTGESPVLGSVDAERQYDPVFEWLRERADLDPQRVAVVGMSFGGYWATKLAHTHRQHVAAAVNWGGPVHGMFERDWVMRSQYAESYLMDIAIARARTVGVDTYEEYADRVANFSLLRQGVLDLPHAPMLLVNGKDDAQVPIEDLYLLLEHGGPKSVRVFPGGHMGYTPQTLPTVVNWLCARLHVD